MTTPTASSDRTAYLVLGMHRSGTSAVTQLLALAGAQLPENVMPGDEHNAKGYFEPWKIAMFNDRRLRAGGGSWDDVFAYPYASMSPKDERAWLNDATKLFEEEFAGAAFPLMKDPRVTVLLPFWRVVLTELEIGARCVIPVRHPLAVAGSLSKRNGFTVEKSVLLWTTYMLAAEAYTRDLPRTFVSYEALLADWRREVARIEAAHGARLPLMTETSAKAIDEFLTPELRHNRSEGDLAAVPHVGVMAKRVYDWCLAAARDKAPRSRPLAESAAELVEMKARFGVFVSPAGRDLDIARVELAELRQHHAYLQAQSQAERDRLQAEQDRLQAELQTVDKILGDLLT